MNSALNNQRALSSAQAAYDNALPEDDLDFLDTDEGEELLREQEEELLANGCSHLVDPEEIWKRLKRDPAFRPVLEKAVDDLMKHAGFHQSCRDYLTAQAQKRMEP